MPTIVRRLQSSRLSMLALCIVVGVLGGVLILVSLRTSAQSPDSHGEEAAAEHQGEEGEEALIELDEEARRLAGIRAEPVRRRALDEWLTAPAVLHANPDETATVSPVVAGTVESVLVTVGDTVRRGQPVVVLRCPDLATAQAEAATAAADLKTAEDSLARRKALSVAGAFSAAPYEDARRAYEETEEKLRLAEAALKRVQRLADLGAPNQPAAEAAATDLSEAREALQAAEAGLAAATEAEATTQRVAERLGGPNGTTGRPAAEAQLTKAETALQTARSNTKRLESLLPDGLATEQELAQSGAAEAEAEADLQEARQALRLIDTPADEARLAAKTAEQESASARACLTEAQARLRVAETRHAREQTVAGEALPAQQQLAEAQTEVAVARAAFAQARLAWDREQRLHGADARSREALAEPESAVAGARARLRAAERIVAVLGQGRQRSAGRVSLVAPVSGKISARAARLGSMAEPGLPLLEITGARSIWVEASFYEKDLPRLAPGQPMRVTMAALPGRTFETTVYAIDAALDEHTRKAKVRGLLDNPGGRLLPDMFATARVRVGALGNALAVPEEAVQSDGDCSLVFVEEAPGRYRRTEVKTGQHTDGLVEVLGGIDPGVRVVTKGAFLLKSEGSAIEDTCGH